MYVLQEINSDCVLCSLTYLFLFVGNKSSADNFKDAIKTFLKESYRLKNSKCMTMNHVTEKVKPQFKLSYNIFE